MHTISLSIDAVSISILIAALAIWAQLWQHYSGDAPPEQVETRERVITVALSWIYAGIFFGLIAFIITLVDFKGFLTTFTGDIAKISFLTSLLMGITSVAESTFALGSKWRAGKTHDNKKGITEKEYKESFKYVACVVGLIVLGSAISILVSSLIGVLIWLLALWIGLKLLLQLMKLND